VNFQIEEGATVEMNSPPGVNPAGRPASAVGDVHRDFKAEAHVAGSGFFPFHAVFSSLIVPHDAVGVPTAYPPARLPVCRVRPARDIVETWIDPS
jgi:hypothetical protein